MFKFLETLTYQYSSTKKVSVTYITQHPNYPSYALVRIHGLNNNLGWEYNPRNAETFYKDMHNKVVCFGFTKKLYWAPFSDLREKT